MERDARFYCAEFVSSSEQLRPQPIVDYQNDICDRAGMCLPYWHPHSIDELKQRLIHFCMCAILSRTLSDIGYGVKYVKHSPVCCQSYSNASSFVFASCGRLMSRNSIFHVDYLPRSFSTQWIHWHSVGTAVNHPSVSFSEHANKPIVFYRLLHCNYSIYQVHHKKVDNFNRKQLTKLL